MGQENESLRETLEKSMSAAETAAASQEGGGGGEEGGSPSGSTTVGEATAAAAEQKTAPEGEEKKAPEGEQKTTPEGEQKTAPKGEEKKAPEGEKKIPEGEKKEPAKAAPKAETKGIRPPESWKPAIRDKHWKTLPPDVQLEVLRRERQVDEALQSSAEARKGMEAVQTVLGQFKDFFEHEKSPPLQAVHNTLNMMRALRFAPPPQRAQLVAQMIKGFDVDVKLLDQALSMVVIPSDPALQAQQRGNAEIQAAIQREMAPIHELLRGLTVQREQLQAKEQGEMVSEIEAFANDPANQYFDLVKDDMADIMELGATKSQKISLQDAYKRAILARNDLAEAYSQDLLKKAAGTLSAPAEAAKRRAAQSVTGSPSLAAPAPAGNSLRDDLAAAVTAHSGRM